jgi:hypothetical protein
MIAGTLNSPLDMLGGYAETEKGTSDAAKTIAKQLREFCNHYSEPRRRILEPEIVALLSADLVDDENAAVTVDTVRTALDFTRLLPKSLPIPEVAADPDGEISFDWVGKTGKMFSVSISAGGRLSYAGRFSDTSKIHGVEQLSETFPREVLVGIEKAIK